MAAYLIVGLVIAALGALIGLPLANRERRAREERLGLRPGSLPKNEPVHRA